MRIAHFGPFDTQSYGGLLLPLIAERRLSDLCESFVHVSPGGSQPLWEDCAPTTAAVDLLRDPLRIDGVIFSGESILPHYPEAREDDTSLSLLARSGLWLTAAYVAARDGLPLCLNAPGASEAAPEDLAQAALLTDFTSAGENAGEHRMDSAPDLTLDVSELWSRDELSAAYSAAFSSRGHSVPERTITFDVGAAGEDVSTIASCMDRICERAGAKPILISLEPGGETLGLVAGQMNAAPLIIDRPRSLREATACIAFSEDYVGSSLHGMIAACSFGKRAMLVNADEKPEAKGFLERHGLSSWAPASWSEAQRRTDELLAEPEATWERALETASPALESHWGRIRETLGTSRERAPRRDAASGGLEAFRASLEENTGMLRRSSGEISALR
ncbi:MAG: polysaccharide pyruvyl transferase family protein, partial [Rubrobacter sp.]|nr:polysaccharide pyruvyl transferase family protein [Rubrobacter sp.]